MQTAIITNGGAFGFTATTHQGTKAETYVAALKNCRILRSQIRDAVRRRNAQTLAEIARGLAGADRCESDSELASRMQFLSGLIEQTRPMDDFEKALADVEQRLLAALDELVACSEEARCVGIERLAIWRRDVELTGEDLVHDRELQARLDTILKPHWPHSYDAPAAYGEEGRRSASTDVPFGYAAPPADQPPREGYASATGGTPAADTMLADAPVPPARPEPRGADATRTESGQRPGRKG